MSETVSLQEKYDTLLLAFVSFLMAQTGCSRERAGSLIAELCVISNRVLIKAPEPEIPEEVKDLLWKTKPEYPISDDAHVSGVLHNEKVIEAFNRGRRLGEQP